MTKPVALLLAAGLLLLCASKAGARRTLLQGTQPPNYQCEDWEDDEIECRLNCGGGSTKLDCELEVSGLVKCELDRGLDDNTFRCGLANGQVDLASCDSNKASIPADCVPQVDELLNAWRPQGS